MSDKNEKPMVIAVNIPDDILDNIAKAREATTEAERDEASKAFVDGLLNLHRRW
jgi:hypothetical protein